MSIEVLDFLEAYKKLDELCKQILSSEKGVSQYIEEMENEGFSRRNIRNWDNDYQKLKDMRRIRNQLAHEVDSFDQSLFSEKDIDWLKDFRSRILEQADPFSLLHQSNTHNAKATLVNNTSINKNLPIKQKPRKARVFIGVFVLAIVVLAIIFILKYV